jgi:iron-sulfur cluster assembly protein
MSISLTAPAAEHVKKQLADSAPDPALRVGVRPTGCSGYMYVVEPAAQPGEHDQIFESQGVRIVVDTASLEYLNGTEIDFRREGLNEGLRFNNPNVAATCGCGESFTI